MTEALKQLWQRCFSDGPEETDRFFETAYSPSRCQCWQEGDTLAAALHWLDCELDGQKLAYVYAVATDPAFRGRGLCRKLMAQTHARLKAQGYAASVLYPANDALRQMYGKMGYRSCGGIRRITAKAQPPVAVRPVSGEEFAALRRRYLPRGGVIQEGENLRYLQTYAQLYAGEGFLLAALREGGRLHGLELLGDETQAGGILGALGCAEGTFRVPGTEAFAMFCPLEADVPAPGYFGLVFD